MKALTVKQPYATRIVKGEKTVENRGRKTELRGRFLIHAGGLLHDGIITREHPLQMPWHKSVEKLPRSAILGSVQIVDCHNASMCGERCVAGGGIRADEAAANDMRRVYHWIFEDPIEFRTPIPRVRGQLGFWQPEDRVVHLASIAEALVA
jgi:hypothetical protein